MYPIQYHLCDLLASRFSRQDCLVSLWEYGHGDSVGGQGIVDLGVSRLIFLFHFVKDNLPSGQKNDHKTRCSYVIGTSDVRILHYNSFHARQHHLRCEQRWVRKSAEVM